MMEKFHLSTTERLILEKLWELKEPIRQTQLLSLFNENGKAWSRQTLNTFLIRLQERGFITREKHMISAVYDKKEFELQILKDAVDNYCDGKMHLAFAAFAERGMITQEETEVLRRTIQEYLDKADLKKSAE